jgi:hypothetical protein
MALSTVAQCLQMARVNLNDAAGTQFVDAVLQPFFDQAHMELMVQMELHQIPVVKDTPANIDVPASPNAVHVLTMPVDFIRTIKVEEKADNAADAQFTEVDEVNDVYNIVVDSRLRFYMWSENEIKFPRCNAARDVRLTYTKAIPTPTTGNISMQLVQLYLSNRTASLAVMYIMQDETRAKALKDDADLWLGRIMTILVRNRQSLPARRIPYNSRSYRRRLPYIVDP